jgi:hypothetical protein
VHHLLVVIGILGQPILSVFKGTAVQKEMDYLTHEDWNSMLPEWFITNCQSMPCDNPERSAVVIWDFCVNKTAQNSTFVLYGIKKKKSLNTDSIMCCTIVIIKSVLNEQKELFKCEQLIVTNYLIMDDVLYMPPHKMHHIQQGIFVDLLALTF